MKKNKSEIVIVLDRSGSMATIQKDMELGLAAFLKKQKKDIGECRVTCYQFDNEINKIFEDVDVQVVEKIPLEPRGSTRLFDAIGLAINEVGARLRKEKEKDRPESIFFITITDGEENSSIEFDNKQIKEMIKHQEDKYSWKFIYLGANQDAFETGRKYGYDGNTSMTYNTTSAGVKNTFNVLSSGILCMRSSADMYANYAFSDSERKSAIEK